MHTNRPAPVLRTTPSAVAVLLLALAVLFSASTVPAAAAQDRPAVQSVPKLRDRSPGRSGGSPVKRVVRQAGTPMGTPMGKAAAGKAAGGKAAGGKAAGGKAAPGKAARGDAGKAASGTDRAAARTPSILIPLGPAEDRRRAGRRGARKPVSGRGKTAKPSGPRRQVAPREASPGIRALRRRIVAVAAREWRFFGGAEWRLKLPSIGRAGLETQPGYRERVMHYWKRGLGRKIRNTRIGWSGAFISFVMREAGAGRRFPYGGSHTWYMARTIKARLSGDKKATFVGYRLSEVAPRPGDMVCNTLTSGVTYDTVGRRRFAAHCDIVVETGNRFIKVIGGNLTNSVRKRTLLTDERGRLYPRQPRRIDPYVKRWLVVIRARQT